MSTIGAKVHVTPWAVASMAACRDENSTRAESKLAASASGMG